MTNITFKESSVHISHEPPKKLHPEVLAVGLVISISFLLISLLFWIYAYFSPQDPININLGLTIGLLGWISTSLVIYFFRASQNSKNFLERNKNLKCLENPKKF